MATSSKHQSDNVAAAFDAVLRALCALCRKARHYAGKFFVDYLMRGAVAWYDRRHPHPSAKRRQHETEASLKLRAAVAAREKECGKLMAEIKAAGQERAQLDFRISQLQAELSQLRSASLGYQKRAADASARTEALEREAEELRRRCLPENEIPAMTYYAQGSATALELRKVSPVRQNGHIYRLTTRPGDTTAATFRPMAVANAAEVIANRNVTLIACEITGIGPSPSAIEPVADGEATFRNNRWEVTRKAKIKLS